MEINVAVVELYWFFNPTGKVSSTWVYSCLRFFAGPITLLLRAWRSCLWELGFFYSCLWFYCFYVVKQICIFTVFDSHSVHYRSFRGGMIKIYIFDQPA